jgi:hypothetical protein
MKKSKKLSIAHTSNSQIGMGDYYGTGIRQKIGRVREGMGMSPISEKKLKTPPRTLA